MSIVIRGNSAAVLSRHPLVDAGRVGVLGESEGGWVAPLAAQRAPSTFALVVLASAPIVTPRTQAAWAVDARIAGPPEWIRRVPAALLAGGRGFVDYPDADVRPALAALDVPVYGVWGADDPIVPVGDAVRVLGAAATTAPVTAVILPGSGHDPVRADGSMTSRSGSQARMLHPGACSEPSHRHVTGLHARPTPPGISVPSPIGSLPSPSQPPRSSCCHGREPVTPER